jgi:hypothetical protein
MDLLLLRWPDGTVAHATQAVVMMAVIAASNGAKLASFAPK